MKANIMASLRSPLGKIRGRIGNLVFKDFENTNLISAAPTGYNVPTDPASVSRRTRFSFVIKLSAALLKLSVRFFWKRSLPAGNRILTRMFRINFPLITDSLNLNGIYLTIKPDFKTVTPELNISNGLIQAVVGPLGTTQKIDTVIATKIAMEGVVCLSEPTDSSAPKYAFIPVSSPEQDLVLDDTLTFNASISGSDAIFAERYAHKSAAVALVTKKADGTPVQCSTTIAN